MAKKKKSDPRWMEKAAKRMKEKGTVGSYGSKSVKQMKKDKAKGGPIAKKANFAINARKAKHGGKKKK